MKIKGVEVKVVDDIGDEPSTMVCVRKNDPVLVASDKNVDGECDECGCAVMYRPDGIPAGRTPRIICATCALPMIQQMVANGDAIVPIVTQATVNDVQEYVRKKMN